MTESLKKLRIFAASPSDVASERAKLETVVESLKPMADYLGLTLEVADWRVVVPDAGRPQQVIFDQLKPTSWDIFVGILWHRFGTPPGAKDKTGKDYLSGTEEEFKTAYELWKQHSKPRMVLYRCTRALPFDVDPDQLKNVRAFFKLIEDTKGNYPTLYQTFDTIEAFEKLVLDNLQKLLIEYGEQSKIPITPETVQVFILKIPNNLPRRAAFFGRANEMEKVLRALDPDDRTWGVLVDGIGGIGKTAIAIEAAYRVQNVVSFDAFVFVTAKQNILDPSGIRELNPPAQTLDEFLNETARVLGQPGIAKLTGGEKRRALLDVLRTMRTLLIYDNLETLSKEEQEGIADFLRELPQGCKAIITSRRRGGEGAVWLRLEALDWDAARDIIENEMVRDLGLANKMRHHASRWQELFDETHGSPLALVHILGLMRVRATLTFDAALEMLRGNRDADMQKFIFCEARKELTDNDKTALGALALFVPSATFEAWMLVAALSRNALETTIDRLSALSLVDILVGEERYALHPITRVFIHSELLANTDVAYEKKMRFAYYWIDFAKKYGLGKESHKTYGQLEAEWKNIEETINWLWKTARVKDESIGNKRAALMIIDLQRSLKDFLLFSRRQDDSKKLDNYRFEMSQVLQGLYVFTPRGDIVVLPTGATPIDFAYHIHTDIGHRCRGARVDGKSVPLEIELKTGDQVEILTVKRGGPSRDWLNFNLGLVKTQRARSTIRAWFKKQDYKQNLASGRTILERELERLGINDKTNLEKLARELKFHATEDLFVALGTGDLSINKIVRQLSEDAEYIEILTAGIPIDETASADVAEIVGLKGLLTRIAKCCNPTPGDEIVGYITRGRGATVHRQDCPNILRMRERERLVAVSWGTQVQTYSVPIRILAYDRQGLMGDISNLLDKEGINIADVTVKTSQNLAYIRLVIEVHDIEQLSRILTRIENLPNVMEAQRTK